MEEEHADLLAGHPFPGGGRTRHPAEAGHLGHGPRTDAQELAVAHGRHGQTGRAIPGVIFCGLELRINLSTVTKP